jgi:hypothetical protein
MYVICTCVPYVCLQQSTIDPQLLKVPPARRPQQQLPIKQPVNWSCHSLTSDYDSGTLSSLSRDSSTVYQQQQAAVMNTVSSSFRSSSPRRARKRCLPRPWCQCTKDYRIDLKWVFTQTHFANRPGFKVAPSRVSTLKWIGGGCSME